MDQRYITIRETKILEYVRDGYGVKQTAGLLKTGEASIRLERRFILAKFNSPNMVAAVAKAIAEGYIKASSYPTTGERKEQGK